MKSSLRAFFCILIAGAPLNAVEALQEQAAEKALELAFFGETEVGPLKITQDQEEEDAPLVATLKDQRPLSVADIPGFDKVPIPQGLRDLLVKVKLGDMVISKQGSVIVIAGKTNLLGEKVTVRLRVEKRGGSLFWSIYIALPQTTALSQLSSAFKDTDIGLKGGFLVLSGTGFTDTGWGGAVSQGATLAGTAQLSVLGKDYRVPLKGLLTRQWVGSELSGRSGGKDFSILLKDEGNLVLRVDNVELALGEKKLQVGASSVQLLPEGDVKAHIEQDGKLGILDIPGINAIPMPESIKKQLKNLTVHSIIIQGTKELVTISGKADLFGSTVDIKVRARKESTKYQWSVRINIPPGVGFAQISDYFTDANFTVIDGFFVLSEADFKDDQWGGPVRRGLSIAGTFIIPDTIATRLNITARSVAISGTITPDWIGSVFSGTLLGKPFEIMVEASGNLSLTFGSIKISSEGLVVGKALTLLPDGTFKVNIGKTGSASLMDVPGMSMIPMPSALKNEFKKVTIADIAVEGTNELVLISGTANFRGNRVKIALRARLTVGKGYLWSARIDVPADFTLSRLSDLFKPVDLSIENGFFILSDDTFEEVSWGGEVKEGLSLVGTFKVAGLIKKLLDAVGTSLNEVTLKGVITADWIGSTFDMEIPGQIDFGKGVKTTGFTLQLAVEKSKVGAPVVSLAIQTGVLLELTDPFTIHAAIKSSPEGIILSGATAGKMKLPGVPLEIEDLKLQADLTPGTPPGVGLGGIFNLGSKKVDMALYVSPPNLLAQGEFRGGLSLQDIVQLLNEVLNVIVAKEIDLVDRMKQVLPNLILKDAKIYVAPKDVTFAGTNYKKGIKVDTTGNIFGKQVEFKAEVSEKGLSMSGFLERTELGPLVIAGTQGDQGAKVQIAISLPLADIAMKSPSEIVKSTGFKASVDARVQLSLGDKLGSASAQTTIDLTPTKAIFTMTTDLFKKTFAVDIAGSVELTNPLSTRGSFTFEQSALDKLSDLLRQGSREILAARDAVKKAQQAASAELKKAEKKASDDLKAAQDHASGELARAKGDVESAQRGLDSANGALSSAQKEIEKIKGDWDAVKEKLKECIG
jgi:hypothetical protein